MAMSHLQCIRRRMSPTMIAPVVVEENNRYQKGVKHLCDNGLTKVPTKYIWPEPDRPIFTKSDKLTKPKQNLKLPIIDFAELLGPNRSHVLRTIAEACETYGFFQVVNHGMEGDVSRNMIEVCKKFFELPYEERSKYMTSDMSAPVRYGTSFNQNKDNVFCWRDFLKLYAHPLPDYLPYWPSSPSDFRSLATTYATETREMFEMMVKAIMESLEIDGDDNEAAKELKEGSQMVVVNCYPPCPEPELTLGMPPHSDYGFLTLLLQDDVEGLQILYRDEWVTIDPIPGSFVINVGDHLEIFSNGRYKSVLHRVLVNSTKPRISVASLHSFPLTSVVKPSPKLIDEHNQPQYMDTDFATFLQYISTREPKWKNFLESRKIHHL
ncbi:probable 2-oxoglutarate-dependent dioxygenase SLC1 isoform X1 [Brassica napus]|nr:probable 2-oxoglutarate-dependent dioxygenase SLC1 isoform X1 [Brassica napus]XP_048626440.1 probable 2-oxoglutarate-dependent dioxygenase SLC1 isoform X1 [Brassica napus]